VLVWFWGILALEGCVLSFARKWPITRLAMPASLLMKSVDPQILNAGISLRFFPTVRIQRTG